MARLTLNYRTVLGLSVASELLVTVTVSALVDAYGPERAGASRPTRGPTVSRPIAHRRRSCPTAEGVEEGGVLRKAEQETQL